VWRRVRRTSGLSVHGRHFVAAEPTEFADDGSSHDLAIRSQARGKQNARWRNRVANIEADGAATPGTRAVGSPQLIAPCLFLRLGRRQEFHWRSVKCALGVFVGQPIDQDRMPHVRVWLSRSQKCAQPSELQMMKYVKHLARRISKRADW